jgi:NAD(P)-dependent dehydrogenase (short-subunit alcohol dehydrogenase family)
LHGAFITLREGARHMVARAEAGEPGGSLVACGSLSLFQGLPGKQNYAASKAGIAAMIRCMAVEFGKYRIRANVVAPGLIITPMMGGEQNAKRWPTPTARALRCGASAIPKTSRASAPTCAARRRRS